MTKATLDERIAASLMNGHAGSADLIELIREAETALAEATETADAELAAALDIATADPHKANERSRAATLTRDRLSPVIPRLRDKLTEALTAERHAKWLAAYRRCVTERDALAKEFFDTYQALAAQLTDLFARMQRCDIGSASIDSMASNSFNGEHRRIGTVERRARGDANGPAILATVQLPTFHDARNLLWPPRVPSLAQAYAATVAPSSAADLEANAGEWWRSIERRDAQRRENFIEAERQGAEREQQIEDQQNAEVRRRVAEAEQAQAALRR